MFTSTHHWHTCRTCKSSQDQWKTARNTSAATLLRSNCTYNLRLQWYKMFQRRLESKNKQGNVNAGCDNVQAKNATNARLHSVCLPTLLFERNATERHIVHGWAVEPSILALPTSHHIFGDSRCFHLFIQCITMSIESIGVQDLTCKIGILALSLQYPDLSTTFWTCAIDCWDTTRWSQNLHIKACSKAPQLRWPFCTCPNPDWNASKDRFFLRFLSSYRNPIRIQFRILKKYFRNHGKNHQFHPSSTVFFQPEASHHLHFEPLNL